MSMGSWTRKKRVECYTPEVLKQIEQDPWNFAPPEGESQKEVEERMLKFLKEKIIDPLWNEAKPNGTVNVAIFGHATAFKCLLRGILGSTPSMTWKINIDNASITELNYNHLGWHVVRINDASHLEQHAN